MPLSNVADLLGRPVVSPDPTLMNKNVYGKSVLVTGAGGSIGSELSKQICELKPSRLVLFEQSEAALYELNQYLTSKANDDSSEIVPILGSIENDTRFRKTLEVFRPNTLFHSAAYKHVSIVEQNIAQGIISNCIGTATIAKAAMDSGVDNFVMISTDKAVKPHNIMGASKRFAEQIIQSYAKSSTATIFSIVRFGNVIGSSGSVIPKFADQIKSGGPVTVTHPEIERYFMTITEAAQLVIQASALAAGGEIFILDMGKPIKIKTLAENMIILSGHSIKTESGGSGEIEIKYVGLQPGEKLTEELVFSGKSINTRHPKIREALESSEPIDDVWSALDKLKEQTRNENIDGIRRSLSRIVKDYVPAPLSDLLHNPSKSNC